MTTIMMMILESDESDQENEINEIDNSSNEPEEESTKDEITSIYPEVCYLCGSLDVNQPTLLDTTCPPRSKEKLPKYESYTSSDSSTKRKGWKSFIKGKKPKNLHKFSRG
ncbi:13281_t:CDS:2 [Dentiscutata heterogama]|uniref:13281_t:CDS:1 n=1 Tax=Dentiscutata heterogama TaxID=1316150 RepID=A0ACA9L083_9GLOM|nr:13281_t:CDS:2 [Dentiscutata heterogama]